MDHPPTGSGKTQIALFAIGKINPKKALVIVNRIELLDQWQQRARSVFGSDPRLGTIGSGMWEEGQIDFAIINTLYGKKGEIDQSWFDQYSLVCVDECHHNQAKMYQEVIGRFAAKYRFGLTATPEKAEYPEIVQAYLGPILHKVSDQALQDSGHILKPKVLVVHTGFSEARNKSDQGDSLSRKIGRRQKGSHKSRDYDPRFYNRILSVLKTDLGRNRLITDKIHEYLGYHQLVVSAHKEHLEIIMRLMKTPKRFDRYPNPVQMLSGKQTRVARQKIIAAIAAAPDSITFSTIADEALDLPMLEVMHFIFPQRSAGATKQKLGRATRVSEKKTGAIILDYVDRHEPILMDQFRNRRFKVYEPLGLKGEINAGD
jgi:superfamily II DNA or RNA helicase